MFLKNIMSKILKNKGGLSLRGELSVGNRNDLQNNCINAACDISELYLFKKNFKRCFLYKSSFAVCDDLEALLQEKLLTI